MGLIDRGVRAVRARFQSMRRTPGDGVMDLPPPVESAQAIESAQADVQPAKYSEARAIIARMGGSVADGGVLSPTAFSVTLGVAPCNHACLFCPQSVHKPAKARWLDLDVLRKVLGEMPQEGVQIGLSSYSETIAAPNLIPAVRLMKEIRPKLRIAMASNGTVFRESVIEDLIDAGLDHYSYSFDAASRDDYARMMQMDHFDRASENLEKLVAMRERKGSSMTITTHIMAFEGRRADFEKFKEYWEKKLDFVQWRTVANWGGDNWGLEKQMAEAGFVAEHKTPDVRYPCFSIMHHFKINWDGYYYPCVAAVPDYKKEFENHCVPTLGHISEVTWQEAWQRLNDMRQAHLEGRWEDYDCCKSCNVWSVYDDIWERETAADGATHYALPKLDAN